MAYRINCKSDQTAGLLIVFKKSKRSKPARGLILLIALGMLALFSLLAVTFVVTAGISKTGSVASQVRSRGGNIAFDGTANKVAHAMIRGTNDQSSPLYMKDLLGDIYGRNPITLNFGHVQTTPPTANPYWCTSLVGGQFLKVSLNQLTAAGGLSPNENEYNSRLITVLEGPLTGQTFRILKYVGFVSHPDNLGLDPNFAQVPRLTLPATTSELPWRSPSYVDPLGSDIDYSILIDLSEIRGATLTGQKTNATGGVENVSGPLSQWLAAPNSLFFFNFPQGGYKCVINDAPFNSPGIGIEDVSGFPGFGNIDSRRLMSIPTLPSLAKISPALLTDYNYLNNTGFVSATIPGIGIPRTSVGQLLLNGNSNEGIDVPDYRDPWLAHQSVYFNASASPPQWVNNIIPSFHRPEVIHYIAGVFLDPAALTPGQVAQLLMLIDASSSRIMSHSFGNVVNPNFRSDDPFYPRILPSFTWSSPPTPLEIFALQDYVKKQIIGPWDFDNNGDGINDSVWADSGMPATSGPDGKLLKAAMAVLIEDLDGRLNVNLHGDRIQGRAAYTATASLSGYQRIGEYVAQGFGFGPADISLNGALNHVPTLITNPVYQISGIDYTTFSFFDDRYGARRYSGRLRNMSEGFRAITFADTGLDRMPGRRSTGLPANDFASQVFEREISGSAYTGRRSSVAGTFDINGNFVFVPPAMDDANPTAPFAVTLPSETADDPYESSALSEANGDDPFSIADLESLLRRFDADANSLPSRLKERLLQDPRNRRTVTDATSPYDVNKLLLDSDVLRQLTVRSVELTHPKLGAAMVNTVRVDSMGLPNDAAAPGLFGTNQILQSPRSLVDLIKMLHSQRYRNRSSANAATDDPELNSAAISSLFPIDFAKGLRLDLNRPFGNGQDSDGDGQVDEPKETGESESYLYYSGGLPAMAAFAIPGTYGREVSPAAGTRFRLSSRQALARSLYCLAQLIIPRNYAFPAISVASPPVAPGSFAWYRIRAHAIAQWAVNVVDFRDSDAAMTRFEFDIFPFGIGTIPADPTKPATLAATTKLAFWAPDYVYIPAAGVPKEFIGVVWGMEMPELLLTESLALHDKRVRDTEMDAMKKSTTSTPAPADPDFDQYRFPQASTFLELYCPRTTVTPGSPLVPGAPSSLYRLASDGTMKLQIGKVIASGTYGLQPVWRIGISNHYPVPPAGVANGNPNTTLQLPSPANAAMNKTTHQVSSAAALAGVATGTPDAILGSGLYSDLTSTATSTPAFDRMVWFTGYAGQTVPDLVATNQSNRLYYNRSTYATSDSQAELAGGSYMVVGPRTETPIGSLTNNPITGNPWPPVLTNAGLAAPIRSPSHQTIRLFPGSISTSFLDGTAAESVWTMPTVATDRIRPAVGMICATNPPNDPAVSDSNVLNAAEEWSDAFRSGVGLNVSLPTPLVGSYLWAEKYRPIYRLNDEDKSRSDGLLGYGDNAAVPNYFPPDSWINIKGTPLPAVVKGNLPDHPFDYPDPNGGPTLNPILNPPGGAPMYQSGTYQNVRAAYLQRLADPEFGYDPVTNPYITVDWISIDLTVFNGEAPPSVLATDDQNNLVSQVAAISLQSRYKDGDVATSTGKATVAPAGQPTLVGAGGLTYHSPSTAQLRTTFIQPPPTAASRYPSYFMHQLGYTSMKTAANPGSSATTLGYLNVGYRGGSLSTPAQSLSETAIVYDGFGPPATNTDPGYYGTVANMTSLAWLNRPFASPHELMLVPLTGPGQFGFYHTVYPDDSDQRHPFRFLPSFQTMNAWRVGHNILGPPAPGTYDADQLGYWAQPASQLMRTVPPAYGNFPVPTVDADWPLLLEFVETRPPFLDAQKVYNPLAIATTLNPSYPMPPPSDPGTTPVSPINRNIRFADRFLDSRLRDGYTGSGEPEVFVGPTLRAPFNMTASYRAAGKVNLNTIAPDNQVGSSAPLRSTVLKGLEYNYLVGSDRFAPGPNTDAIDPLTFQFMSTRRGYALGVISPFFASFPTTAANPNGSNIAPHLNPYYPTQFVGAYRSALTSNLAPHIEDPTARAVMRSKYGVEATLARSFALADTTVSTPGENLPGSAAPADAMLFSPNSVSGVLGSTVPITPSATADANRNAFTRFQREMRLPNLITNQSNVFAMWVTVSLYEYDPVTGFGNEYLDVNGLPKRERMFYIIDRSIPVGYKPGENLNTDRTVLLKRKLD